MSTIVVMPGGFHPFHAGHAALYQSALKTFPGAEVFVAATNDTSNRPFPFAIKEKLAKLAGVEPGHFVQVKSPFQAREITSQFNPEKDRLIFVRSEKDASKPPQAGGVKKDGNPAYLQPLAGQTNIRPFGEHAYMAYLPTVEFGPGMTSATEIRSAWPQLNSKRKTALVMSLYPATQKNPALAATVVKMLDTAMGVEEQGVTEARPILSSEDTLTNIKKLWQYTNRNLTDLASNASFDEEHYNKPYVEERLNNLLKTPDGNPVEIAFDMEPSIRFKNNILYIPIGVMWSYRGMYQGPTFIKQVTDLLNDQQSTTEAVNPMTANAQGSGAGMYAAYQSRENQPIDEDYIDERSS